jgi:hypothetical protein
MGLEKEAYLHDYIAAGLLGSTVGTAFTGIIIVAMHGFATAVNVFGAGSPNWGAVIALGIVAGLFGFTAGGFISGYLNFRFHRSERTPMEGLSAGVFAFIVHLFMTLFIFVAWAASSGGAAGSVMTIWAISVAFAVIFYPLGGYLSGVIEGRMIPIPAFLIFTGKPSPPPPPPAARACTTCGQPLTFTQRHRRWYCSSCKKYQ